MQFGDLVLAERGGRLVKNEQRRVGSDGLGDLDKLLARHRERANDRVRIDVDPEARQNRPRVVAHGLPVDAPGLYGQAPEMDILGDRKGRHQREFLEHGGNAEFARDDRTRNADRRAVAEDLTGVGLVDTGQGLDNS